MSEHLIEMGRSRCPSGKIWRVPYKRSDGTRVKGTCVPDTGAPGKTPASKRFIPKMGPGTLTGWHKDQAASTRHAKLAKLTKSVGCREALRRVNVIANATTDRPTEAKLRTDYKWLRNQGFCHLKTK